MSATRRTRTAGAQRTTRPPRTNPPLAIFGNPGHRGRAAASTVITDDVKAIVYRHPEDGELYVHAFGCCGESIRLETLADGVAIRRLPRGKTKTLAVANANGTVTLANQSRRPLWKDF